MLIDVARRADSQISSAATDSRARAFRVRRHPSVDNVPAGKSICQGDGTFQSRSEQRLSVRYAGAVFSNEAAPQTDESRSMGILYLHPARRRVEMGMHYRGPAALRLAAAVRYA